MTNSFQVVLPAILEQTHARNLIKVVVFLWCKVLGRLLNLEHYLLPDETTPANANRPPVPVAVQEGGLAAQHQVFLLLKVWQKTRIMLGISPRKNFFLD